MKTLSTSILLAFLFCAQTALAQVFREAPVSIPSDLPDDFIPLDNGVFVYIGEENEDMRLLKLKNTNEYTLELIEFSFAPVSKIRIMDFNSDGHNDLWAFDTNLNRWRCFLWKNGTYVFNPEFSFTYRNPWTFFTGDFNKDGKDDIFLERSVLVQTEPGEFELGISLTGTPGNQTYGSKHSADINNDGRMDVIGETNNRLHVYLQKEDGKTTMVRMDDYSVHDVFSHEYNGESVLIYRHDVELRRLNYVNGEFEHKVLYTGEGSLNTIGTIDVDEDGEMEFIKSGSGGKEILRYDHANDTFITDIFSYSHLLGNDLYKYEFDGETYYINESAGRLQGFQLNGTSFNQVFEYPNGLFGIKGDFQDYLIDIDGDGFTDAVNFIGGSKGYNVKRYLGQENFVGVETIRFPNNYGEFKDHDDDGDYDFLLEDEWHENLGNLEFSAAKYRQDPPPYPEPNIYFTVVHLEEDLDNDGDIDLITYNNFGEPLEVHENINNSHFEYGFTIATVDHISGDLVGLHAIDADGDGDKDIIMAAKSGLIFIECIGTLSYATPVILQEGIQKPRELDIADMNYDGFPDLLLSTYDNPAGSFNGMTDLYFGTANGPTLFKQIDAGNGTYRASFANIDEKGPLDIVFLHWNYMYWVSLEADSSLKSNLISRDFGINRRLEIHDVDSDGDDDLVTYCTSCYAPIPNQDFRYSYFINYANDSIPLTGEDTTSSRECPLSDVYIMNVDHRDHFKENYAACEVIDGHLSVSATIAATDNFQSRDALINLKEVKGDLTLTWSGDLHGISSLEKVHGDFSLREYRGNHLGGLQKLAYVGGDINFYKLYEDAGDNGNVDSLISLAYVGGGFTFERGYYEHLNFPLITPDSIHGDLKVQVYGPSDVESFLSECTYVQNNFTLIANDTIESLDFLSPNFYVGDSWNMYGNRKLNYCQVEPLCRHIDQGRPYYIFSNGPSCSKLGGIACEEQDFSGIVFYDLNENGIFEPSESRLSNFEIKFKNVDELAITSFSGEYSNYFGGGEEISAELINPDGWVFTTDSVIRIDSFISGAAENNQNNFGVKQIGSFLEPKAWLTVGEIDCDRLSTVSVDFNNNTLDKQSVKLDLFYPNEVSLDINYIDYTNHDQNNRIITWESNDIPSFNSLSFRPTFQPSILIEDEDRLLFKLVVSVFESGIYKALDTVAIFKTVSCQTNTSVSKNVYPADSLEISQINTLAPLVYTIHFSNQTTSPVQHVLIRDWLHDRLNNTTFKLISSSHPVSISRDGSEVLFTFSDINLLPESVSPEGSQGFVVFSAAPDDDIPLGTDIYNDATIYYDYLLSEESNEVVTRYDEFSSNENTFIDSEYNIVIAPQPSQTYFNVLIPHELCHQGELELRVFSPLGNMIQQGSVACFSTINTQSWSSGMYSIQLTNKGGELLLNRKVLQIK